jgi:superfamily II DNA or RNA helicase
LSEIKPGIYEAIVTEVLAAELALLEPSLSAQTNRLRHAEVADRLAMHLGSVLERALNDLDDKDRVDVGVKLVRSLIGKIVAVTAVSGLGVEQPADVGELLTSILSFNPDGTLLKRAAPTIPLLDTTLLTNAPGEPRVGSQIQTEIDSADRIDIVMAFIRRTGIRPFLDALRRHCQNSCEQLPLRVLTTVYTNSTELEALVILKELGAEIKVSYDISTARLHAKAWQFYRGSGASTAYIGSSNLTHSAQVAGLEWNVRVSGLRNPDVIRKMSSVFDAYWESEDFRAFDVEEFKEATKRIESNGPAVFLSPVELRLEPFQERLLEQINVARRAGHHRNLLVAATGTGKTVIAAVDYLNLRETLPRSRLLFVAHREEILDQSMATFRHALRDANFGEKWVGGHRPTHFEHVFASIQTLNAVQYQDLDPAHFDVVIVDEFHHAAATSYEKFLRHVQPVELLGLTATPERADGLDVLAWFEGGIAAELRLWDAIDQHRLVPFSYFGVHDGLDLRDLPWRRGVGYEIQALSNLYTSDEAWARRVIIELQKRVDSVFSMRALGFCVSVAHAQFMANVFSKADIPAAAVWGNTPGVERRRALAMLASGEINILFSVDLFNEGVDLPTVDTLLLLRPTDSATLFLQQIGRGLRKSRDKSMCTILDFVGLHRREFRFDRRLGALIGGTRKQIESQIASNFPFLPSGCHMELDEVTTKTVLQSLKSAIPTGRTRLIAELRVLIANSLSPTLANFLHELDIDLPEIYTGNRCWSDYLQGAQVQMLTEGPHEVVLRRAIGRLLHVDDEQRLDLYLALLGSSQAPVIELLAEKDRRLLRMLVSSVCEQAIDKTHTQQFATDLLWAHPQVIAELFELFTILRGRIDHLHQSIGTHPNVPLQLHGKYSRIEILAAFGDGVGAKTPAWREGVKWIEEENADVFVFTLNKADGNFSPTTRYRDYAISRELIHWESQSGTGATSPTGLRYREHQSRGTSLMLFARESTADRAFWFIGPANYVSHESERPMGIKCRLHYSLPGDLYTAFAAAVA